jgi:hypothetical protein
LSDQHHNNVAGNHDHHPTSLYHDLDDLLVHGTYDEHVNDFAEYEYVDHDWECHYYDLVAEYDNHDGARDQHDDHITRIDDNDVIRHQHDNDQYGQHDDDRPDHDDDRSDHHDDVAEHLHDNHVARREHDHNGADHNDDITEHNDDNHVYDYDNRCGDHQSWIGFR